MSTLSGSDELWRTTMIKYKFSKTYFETNRFTEPNWTTRNDEKYVFFFELWISCTLHEASGSHMCIHRLRCRVLALLWYVYTFAACVVNGLSCVSAFGRLKIAKTWENCHRTMTRPSLANRARLGNAALFVWKEDGWIRARVSSMNKNNRIPLFTVWARMGRFMCDAHTFPVRHFTHTKTAHTQLPHPSVRATQKNKPIFGLLTHWKSRLINRTPNAMIKIHRFVMSLCQPIEQIKHRNTKVCDEREEKNFSGNETKYTHTHSTCYCCVAIRTRLKSNTQ